jgi:hypothetical protein
MMSLDTVCPEICGVTYNNVLVLDQIWQINVKSMAQVVDLRTILQRNNFVD